MRIVRREIDGPMILRESLRIDGGVTGDVTVPSGLRLVLNGVVKGGLLLCADAFADIRGEVRGTLHNEGGAYALTGSIGGLRTTTGKRRA